MPKRTSVEKIPEWKIKELAQSFGIENPHDLHLRVGGISYPRTVKAWNGNARLNAAEITRYSEFFECLPGELISIPTSRRSNPKTNAKK